MPKFRPDNSINSKHTKHSINNNSRLGDTTKKRDSNTEEAALKTLGSAIQRGCM